MFTAKSLATFAVIVGCFAVLYPKFLHPMVLKVFGYKSVDDKENTGRNNANGQGRPPNMAQGQDMRQQQHTRPGPHPGMRASADMARQQTQHGSGRGMMGIVLPMYAVGIVVYLVYTLMKVFGKKDQEEETVRPQSIIPDNLTAQDARDLWGKDKRQELEDLLLKADDKAINEVEMRKLQTRLEETEAQMTQILNAMKHIQPDVVPPKMSDSSPDMDSYEIVNKDSSPTTQKSQPGNDGDEVVNKDSSPATQKSQPGNDGDAKEKDEHSVETVGNQEPACKREKPDGRTSPNSDEICKPMKDEDGEDAKVDNENVDNDNVDNDKDSESDKQGDVKADNIDEEIVDNLHGEETIRHRKSHHQ